MSAAGPLSVREAQRLTLERARPLPAEDAPLAEALGRVLTEPITARFDLPPFDNAAMDGYAVRASDAQNGRPLPVTLDLPAGAGPAALGAGAAARIMTGGPLPASADAVVPVERSEGPGGAGVFAAVGEMVRFASPPAAGDHVRRRGEDVRAGEVVLAAGELMTPARIAMAAANGRATIHLVRRPRVAILSTGDELVDVDRAGEPNRIVDGNSYGIAAQVRAAGGVPHRFPIVSDDRAAIRDALAGAIAAADAVVTIGGVSMGDRDHVRGAITEAGAELLFWRVAIRPGGPTALALAPGGKLVFGLPGNPVSAQVSFELFARPALRRMAGHARCFRRAVRARLAQAVETPGEKTYVLRGRLQRVANGWTVSPSGPQTSGVLSALARADALIIVPGESASLPAGAEVDVLPIEEGEWTMSEEP